MTTKDSLDETLDDAWKTLKTPIKVVAAGILGGLLLITSCFYCPQDSNVIVETLGKYTETRGPGFPQFIWPFIQSKRIIPTSKPRKIELGFRTKKDAETSEYEVGSQFQGEYLQLLGDRSMADVELTVQWEVSDPVAYNYSLVNPDKLIKDRAQAVLSRICGDAGYDEVAKERVTQICKEGQQELQTIVDAFHTGQKATIYQTQGVNPPANVAPSIDSVNQANSVKESKIAIARGEYSRRVQEAEGKMTATISGAQGDSMDLTNNCEGDISRYNSLLSQYRKFPEITKARLLLDARQSFYSNTGDKWVTKDGKATPLLPLSPFGGEK